MVDFNISGNRAYQTMQNVDLLKTNKASSTSISDTKSTSSVAATDQVNISAEALQKLNNEMMAGGDGIRPMAGGDGLRPMAGGDGLRPMAGGDGLRPMAGGDGLRPMAGGDGNNS